MCFLNLRYNDTLFVNAGFNFSFSFKDCNCVYDVNNNNEYNIIHIATGC